MKRVNLLEHDNKSLAKLFKESKGFLNIEYFFIGDIRFYLSEMNMNSEWDPQIKFTFENECYFESDRKKVWII